MDYRLFIAVHYLRRKSREPFVHFSILTSILGIAIGVAALILVLGVMSGFSSSLKEKIAGSFASITISQRRPITDYETVIKRTKNSLGKEIVGISPFIETQALFQSGNGISGGIVKGIDPEREIAVTNVKDWLKKKKLDLSGNKIILGKELARTLGVKKGEKLRLISGLSGKGSDFIVSGFFESGLYATDSAYSFINLNKAQEEFLFPGMVTGIGVKTRNLLKSERSAQSLAHSLGKNFIVRSWLRENKVLFAAIALEKRAMSIILALISLVAAFNIASSLMTMVYRKVKDIGILKSLGVTKKGIRIIFILKGMLMGVTGLVLGLSIGLFLAFLLEKYQFIKLPAFVYDLSYLPIKVQGSDLLTISATVLIITFLATLYPAWKAGKLEPTEALRYE